MCLPHRLLGLLEGGFERFQRVQHGSEFAACGHLVVGGLGFLESLGAGLPDGLQGLEGRFPLSQSLVQRGGGCVTQLGQGLAQLLDRFLPSPLLTRVLGSPAQPLVCPPPFVPLADLLLERLDLLFEVGESAGSGVHIRQAIQEGLELGSARLRLPGQSFHLGPDGLQIGLDLRPDLDPLEALFSLRVVGVEVQRPPEVTDRFFLSSRLPRPLPDLHQRLLQSLGGLRTAGPAVVGRLESLHCGEGVGRRPASLHLLLEEVYFRLGPVEAVGGPALVVTQQGVERLAEAVGRLPRPPLLQQPLPVLQPPLLLPDALDLPLQRLVHGPHDGSDGGVVPPLAPGVLDAAQGPLQRLQRLLPPPRLPIGPSLVLLDGDLNQVGGLVAEGGGRGVTGVDLQHFPERPAGLLEVAPGGLELPLGVGLPALVQRLLTMGHPHLEPEPVPGGAVGVLLSQVVQFGEGVGPAALLERAFRPLQRGLDETPEEVPGLSQKALGVGVARGGGGNSLGQLHRPLEVLGPVSPAGLL